MRHKPQNQLMLIACLLLAICNTSAPEVQAQTVLKYRFNPDQKLRYELKQSLVTKTEFSGEVTTNTIAQHLNLSTTVEKVLSDGSARVNKTINRIRIKASQPGSEEELEYDSDHQGETTGQFAMIVKSMSMLVDQNIVMTVNPQGESSHVTIPEELVKRFSSPEGNSGGVNSQEGVKKMMSQGSVIFPEKPLSRGDHWKREIDTELPYGTMKSIIIFTYAGKTSKGLHRIDAKTEITIKPNDNAPFQMKMTDSQGHGVYLFDAQRGLILASGLKQTMNMEVLAAGQTTKQSVVTDVSMRLINEKK